MTGFQGIGRSWTRSAIQVSGLLRHNRPRCTTSRRFRTPTVRAGLDERAIVGEVCAIPSRRASAYFAVLGTVEKVVLLSGFWGEGSHRGRDPEQLQRESSIQLGHSSHYQVGPLHAVQRIR